MIPKNLFSSALWKVLSMTKYPGILSWEETEPGSWASGHTELIHHTGQMSDGDPPTEGRGNDG